MAPEMVGGGPLDGRTDVYLLGAILHEILTGQARHAGPTLGSCIGSILESAPVEYPDEHEELGEVANRATARDPGARFESVRAMREAILRHLEHRESSALSDEADRMLAALETQGGAARRSQLTAVRFAYREALQRWEGNTSAAIGLQRVLTEMVRLEIEDGQRAAAAALLAEIPDPEPELTRELAVLDARIAGERSHVRALEEMAADHDPALRAHDRRRALIAITLVATLVIGLGLSLKWLGILRPSYLQLIIVGSVPACLALFAMLRTPLGRSSEINRRVGWSLTVVLVAAPLIRIAAWTAGIPDTTTLAFELAAYALASALIGIGVHRSFLPLAPVIGAGYVAILYWPEWSHEIASGVMLAALSIIAQRWSRAGGPAA